MALILRQKQKIFILTILLASCLLTFGVVSQIKVTSGAWIVWFVFLFCALQTGRLAWEFEAAQTQRPEVAKLSHWRWMLRCVLLNILYLAITGLLPFVVLGLGLTLLDAQTYEWSSLVLMAIVLVLPTAVAGGVVAGVFNSWLLRLGADLPPQ